MHFSQFNSIHKVETPSKMSYLRFISCTLTLARIDSLEITVPRFPSWTLILASSRDNNTCIFNLVKIILHVLSRLQLSREFRCQFAVSHRQRKPRRNLTVACHRHPTELTFRRNLTRLKYYANWIHGPIFSRFVYLKNFKTSKTKRISSRYDQKSFFIALYNFFYVCGLVHFELVSAPLTCFCESTN